MIPLKQQLDFSRWPIHLNGSAKQKKPNGYLIIMPVWLYLHAGWNDPNIDKDANCTRINALCDKAEALDKNSEIYVLRNMSATQQMMVDPQTRWQTYGTAGR